jgi:cytoskeletal protein RodZ
MAQTATITSYEYAAGTCTLRLVGELSPLSQVTGRPVLGRSRFTLQVHGDDAPGETRAAATQAVIFETSGREPQFSALADLAQTYVQQQLSADALATGGAVTRGENTLQPVGLTRHRLTLAAPPAPPRVVELSTLQLSDLADALEQADGNLQIIPDAALPKTRRVRPKLPLWLGSVAAVGIAALLGNQFLTTAPSPVVFSPDGSPTSESQTLNGATAESPADSRQQSLEESAPTADASTETGAVTGEAVPAPITTAPTTTSAPSGEVAEPETAKTSPQPVPAPPAPAARPPQTATAPASAYPPQAEAQGEQGESPDADMAAEQFPNAARPDTRRAPGAPEAFDASPDIAATAAPDSALDWITALTFTLQQQWRPPANLAAPLRYRLTLEPDGTITILEPLNDFSATYQNNFSLPQPGDTISVVVRDESTTVEVQFLPSGDVVVVPPAEANP